MAPVDGTDPLANAEMIEAELEHYSPALAAKPIWMVLSKADISSEEALAELKERLLEAFPGRSVFVISAVTGRGVTELVDALREAVAEFRRALNEDEEFAAEQAALEAAIGEDVLNSALARQAERRRRRHAEDADDDDDSEAEVVYVDG